MEHIENKASKNIIEDNIEKLRLLFPEAFTESSDEGEPRWKVDFETLKQILGDYTEDRQERYSFSWNGKSRARLIAQTPSTGTLRPCPEESVDWDATKNLFIEGDNLEVLKLLQKSYHKKVKMIYIDPPYNTGNEFIYPDKFQDNLDTYLRYTGQVDDEGFKVSTNSETGGRYHTNWLNMMYPRLKLARNLLRDDGLLFISINDREATNLRLLLNEIYGEENFISCLIWDKNHSAQAGVFKVYHEYVFVYAKDINLVKTPKSKDKEHFEAGAMKRESGRHPLQKFRFPKGTRFNAPHGTELNGGWGGTEKVRLVEGKMISQNGYLKEDIVLEAAFTQANQMKQFFYGDRENLFDSREQRIVDFYFTESGKLKIVKERGVTTPSTVQRWGTQSDVSNKLSELFGMSQAPLETPKSLRMLSDFISWFMDENDIFLDFFAGSCASAHASLSANSETRKRNNFIMVQLPEPTKEDSEAYKAGYKTIAEIGKERIRRAGKKIREENTDYDGDLGFKVFKLDSSNIKPWDADFDNYKEALMNSVENIKTERTEQDVLFELLLKYGLDLTIPIETRSIQGKNVCIIGAGALVVCLDDEITLDAVEEIAKLKEELKPEVMRVVFKDAGFKDATVKTNTVQILKIAGIEDVKSL